MMVICSPSMKRFFAEFNEVGVKIGACAASVKDATVLHANRRGTAYHFLAL